VIIGFGKLHQSKRLLLLSAHAVFARFLRTFAAPQSASGLAPSSASRRLLMSAFYFATPARTE